MNHTKRMRALMLTLAVALPPFMAVARADGPGEFKFDEESFSVIEEAGVAIITVERSRGEDGAVSVDYATTGGTATDGADYLAVSGTFTWGDQDESDRTFEVPILDDADAEGAETIELVLSNPTGGGILHATRSTSVLIILASDGGGGTGDDDDDDDNDPGVFKFDEDSFEVIEESGMAIITVERSMGESGVVSVDYATAGGTATADGDYTPAAGTLTWADQDGADKTFTVPILDDADAEGAETIELVLSNPTGGGGLHPTRGTSVLIILASDGGTGGGGGGGGDTGDAGVVKFDELSFEVLESAGVALVRVERSQGEDGAVSVDYATSDGTATDGSDYTGVSGTLDWPHGDGTDRTFVVPILDDTDPEGLENIHLTLSTVTGGATIDPLRGTSEVRILANDGGTGGGGGGGGTPGTVKFDELSFEVIEESGIAVVTVERSMGEDGVVSVEYSTADGSATDGSDYVGTSGVLTWADQDGADKTFTVSILDDADAEGDETILLNLLNATGGAVIDGVQGSSTLIILASDGGTGGGGGGGGGGDGAAGTIKVGSTRYQALEQGGMAILTVERSQGDTGAVSVDYFTNDGTAFDGEDYSAVAGTLSWANGDGGDRTVMVPILDDTVAEVNETFDLLLVNAAGGATIDPLRDAAVVTIIDDDNTARCRPSDTVLCMAGGRFRVEITYATPQGTSGRARTLALSDSSGLFYFFGSGNIEVLTKVLDACQDFGSFWFFLSATTNLELEMAVTDTITGDSRIYRNGQGETAKPIIDTTTFASCP